MSTQLLSDGTSVQLGRGRKTNTIIAIQTATAGWKSVPQRVHQWGLQERLDTWTRQVGEGCLAGAEESGFNLLWHYWRKHESAEELARSLFPDHGDAAIILAPREEHRPLIEVLAAMGVPVVVAYARHPDARVAWVVCDNRGGAARAVQHLAEAGRTRIGFLGGPSNIPDLRERREGYLEGLELAGLPADPSLVLEAGPRLDVEDAEPAASRLLHAAEGLDAVFCATDALAAAVVQAAWKKGLSVPGDVAVVGYDDSELATQVVPQLTSVRQPVLEIANQATYLAACAAVGQEPETGAWHIEHPVELVVRESSGAAADGGSAPGAAAEMQSARRELEQRLHQLAATREEMRELLSIASHDLRSPLVSIKGFASRLDRKHRESLDEAGRRDLGRIIHNAEHMDELIDSLLTVSRSHNQPLNLGPVAVWDTVVSVLRQLEGPIRETRTDIILPNDFPTVMADAVALRQLFANLIANALKYMGDQPRPQIEIGHARRDSENEFWIRDNGIGIAAQYHDQIFQLFRRGPTTAAKGSGIGLTTAKAVVLRHGGRIWVESQEGQGATFRFVLPRREGTS